MLIEVTQEDIKNGAARDEQSCAVALAVNRALGLDCVWVGREMVDIGCDKIDLPAEAQTFIDNFDNDFPVKPFSFEL